MKKDLLLVAGIVVSEALFWTLCGADAYYWVLALTGSVAAIVFGVKLIRNTKGAAFKPVGWYVSRNGKCLTTRANYLQNSPLQ